MANEVAEEPDSPWGGLVGLRRNTGDTSPVVRPTKIARPSKVKAAVVAPQKETAVVATARKEPAVVAPRKEQVVIATTTRHQQLLGNPLP